jgi:hypothetical protein
MLTPGVKTDRAPDKATEKLKAQKNWVLSKLKSGVKMLTPGANSKC